MIGQSAMIDPDLFPGEAPALWVVSVDPQTGRLGSGGCAAMIYRPTLKAWGFAIYGKPAPQWSKAGPGWLALVHLGIRDAVTLTRLEAIRRRYI